MMNLHDGLARIAGPDAEPTPDQVAADLARGQRALRRRRTTQAAGGSVFAAAALAAAIVAGGGASPAGGPSAPQAGGNQPATSAPAVPVTRLVAYQGEQPKGFTLDKVPQGWELQGAGELGLTIAPKGFADQNPNSFEGKIAAFLQESYPEDELKGKEVIVNGDKGVLTKMLEQTDGHALFVKLADNRYLVVQVWDGLGWGEKEVLEFASGIHIDKNAKVTHG